MTNMISSNLTPSKIAQKQAVNFTGHDFKNGKVEFFLPGKKEDAPTAKVVVYDVEGNKAKPETKKEIPLEYSQGYLRAQTDDLLNNRRYAYKFDLGNTPGGSKEIVDLTQKAFLDPEKREGGLAITRDPGIKSFKHNHSMYHALPDSFYDPHSEKYSWTDEGIEILLNEDGTSKLPRNHFNTYGGNIEGFLAKIDYLDNLKPGRILGNPLFGFDEMSNHGYWTENAFQIAPLKGTIKEFDKLNVELFKKGMSWIADGAFINQGLQGSQLRDVLLRGEGGSDFIDRSDLKKCWFTDLENGKAIPPGQLALGVLPQDDNGNIIEKAYDFQLLNSPVDKFGNKLPVFNPTDTKFAEMDSSKYYNPTLPTYIKLFDPTLSGDGTNLDGKQRLQRNTQSVQEYAFPVNPDELAGKILNPNSNWGRSTQVSVPKEELLEWENFTLTTSSKAGGLNFWYGNRDVPKINTQNPEIKQMVASAGSFWTIRTDNALLDHTAKELSKVLSDSKNVTLEDLKTATLQLIKNNQAPKTLLDEENPAVLSQHTVDALEKALKTPDIAVLKVPQPASPDADITERDIKPAQTLKQAIKSYPLESIEFPQEMAAIFSSTHFKNEMEEQGVYNQLASVAEKIIEKTGIDELKQPEMFRMVYQDITKSLILRTLGNQEVLPSMDIGSQEDRDKLKVTTFMDMPAFFKGTTQQAADQTAWKIRDNLEILEKEIDAASLTSSNFAGELIKEVKEKVDGLNPQVINAAKGIINASEAGLDWRLDAAKDVAKDIEGKVKHASDPEVAKQITQDVQDFWKPFCSAIRSNNENSYIIAEITDINWAELLDKDLFNGVTNYNYIFGGIPAALHKSVDGREAKTANQFMDRVKEYVETLPLAAANNIQQMVDCHDRARILTNLLVPSDEYRDGRGNTVDSMKKTIQAGISSAFNIDEAKTVDQNASINPDFKIATKAIELAALENAKNFAYEPLNTVFNDIKSKVKEIAPNEADRVNQKLDQGYSDLFNAASDKYIRSLYLQVGIPGAVDMYYGTELGMTGGETGDEEYRKNLTVKDRELMSWVFLDDKNEIKDPNSVSPELKQVYEDVQKHFNKVKTVFSLRSDPKLKALNDGFMVDIGTKDDKGLIALMRYNDKNQALVLANTGLPANGTTQAGYECAKDIGPFNYGGNYPVTQPVLSNIDLNLGAQGLDIGAVFVNAENDQDKYVVWKDGKLRKAPEKLELTPDSSINASRMSMVEAGELPSIKEGMILYRTDKGAPDPSKKPLSTATMASTPHQEPSFRGRKVLGFV